MTGMDPSLHDTRAVERSVPRHYSFSAPFWEATRERRLLLQYCRQSGRYQFYPRPISIFSGSRDLEWREAAGGGTLFSWTIARIARPPFAAETPFAIATVTLDEGVNMIANLIDCDPESLAIGLRVHLAWLPLADGSNLPVFTPENAQAARAVKSSAIEGETM